LGPSTTATPPLQTDPLGPTGGLGPTPAGAVSQARVPNAPVHSAPPSLPAPLTALLGVGHAVVLAGAHGAVGVAGARAAGAVDGAGGWGAGGGGVRVWERVGGGGGPVGRVPHGSGRPGATVFPAAPRGAAAARPSPGDTQRAQRAYCSLCRSRRCPARSGSPMTARWQGWSRLCTCCWCRSCGWAVGGGKGAVAVSPPQAATQQRRARLAAPAGVATARASSVILHVPAGGLTRWRTAARTCLQLQGRRAAGRHVSRCRHPTC
jgi:hypothetical protein